MTYAEYQEYEKRVASFFKRTGLINLSPISDEEGNWDEGFHIGPCFCCGSHLGGTYIECDGYIPVTKEIAQYRVCQDCVYYAEYGQLDDQTMLDIEDFPGK